MRALSLRELRHSHISCCSRISLLPCGRRWRAAPDEGSHRPIRLWGWRSQSRARDPSSFAMGLPPAFAGVRHGEAFSHKGRRRSEGVGRCVNPIALPSPSRRRGAVRPEPTPSARWPGRRSGAGSFAGRAPDAIFVGGVALGRADGPRARCAAASSRDPGAEVQGATRRPRSRPLPREDAARDPRRPKSPWRSRPGRGSGRRRWRKERPGRQARRRETRGLPRWPRRR